MLENDADIRQGSNAERAADRRADRIAYGLVGVMIAVSLAVEFASRRAEIAENGLAMGGFETLILEGSSHLVILGLLPLVPFVLNRAPLSLEAWRWTGPILAGGALAFSVLHVGMMYLIRLALFPLFLGKTYDVNLLAPSRFGYEFPKDLYTYLTLLIVFIAARIIEQRRLEAKASVESARTDQRLTLKSGGTSFIVNASDIRVANAAGNYVEVRTAQKTFLARMTMSALERLLKESGDSHIRVHRSYLVNRNHIRTVTPSGDGGVTIELDDGEKIPCSRNYRDRLPIS